MEGRSPDAASERGKEVLVGWRPEHAVVVPQKTKHEEDRQ
jgi:hypothetical protein